MRRARNAIAFVLLAAFSCAQAFAQEPPAAPTLAQESGERVQLKDGRISFVLPRGFKPMSKEHIAFKFGRLGAEKAPKFVYSNKPQNVSVAVDFIGSGLQNARLEDLSKGFKEVWERIIPGVEWLESEIITRDGRQWMHLRLKSAAIDTGVYNDIYATIFEGQLLTFNFNSTIAQYEKYKESLRHSAQSITVK
ncbi:MAG TPA: hypothetical protein VD835_12935 [Pyrinomonadaceae bacterium]|nr:hypothetical protein [Pyrinomonadaceae bacterium]